ncbi:hypothetical protein [Streptomyces sp. NPDC057702]|uniref:hypothetical protein n=1 Tax=unclassified Streptomyces TaxID=2593676 RepID=UPI00369B0A3D
MATDGKQSDAPKSGIRGRLAELPRAVGRVLRQDRGDDFARRMLPRVVFGLAGAYTLIQFAASSGGAFLVTCVIIALGLVAWWLRKRRQLALALISTVVTVACTGVLSQGLDVARRVPEGAAGGQAVFGFWALAGMALLGAWIPQRQSGGRGVTVVIVDVFLLLAAFLGAWLPGVAVWCGFIAVVLVLLVRSRPERANVELARRLLRRLPLPRRMAGLGRPRG